MGDAASACVIYAKQIIYVMINTSLLISIIVPIYNAEDYLCKCVYSLLNQSHRNIKIFLVDDGSTDFSSEICDQYAREDTRIKVIHKANGGQSTARNNLVKKMSMSEFSATI